MSGVRCSKRVLLMTKMLTILTVRSVLLCTRVRCHAALSLFFPGCSCFLLFVCHRTSVCGPAGDAAAYHVAAKNFRWAKKSLSGFSTFLFAFILYIYIFFYFSCRGTLLVGLSHGGLALHPWNELWLFTWGGAGGEPSFRYGAPRVSGPTLGSSGRPADCFQPLALSGPLLLLGVVDRRLPLLHLTVRPFLPPVSHGSIASAAERWETGPLQLNGVLCPGMADWGACWPADDTAPPPQWLFLPSELLVQPSVLPQLMTRFYDFNPLVFILFDEETLWGGGMLFSATGEHCCNPEKAIQ